MASSYEVAKSFDPLRRYPQTLDYPLRVVDYSSISGQSPAGQYQSDPLITAHDVDIDPSLLHECPKIPQLDSASLSPQFTQVLSGPDRRHRDRAFVCRLFIDRETRILKIVSARGQFTVPLIDAYITRLRSTRATQTCPTASTASIAHTHA